MAFEIRTITDDELEAWGEAVANGFLGHAAPGAADFRRAYFDLDRTWAAFDGGRLVGNLRSFASELTVPGGSPVPVHALTAVGVRPTHRRQGILTRMLGLDLASAVERGEVASILIASEWPIYGRYGYGPATETCTWTLDTTLARFRGPERGTIELVTPGELLDVLPAAVDRYRRAQPGAITLPKGLWPVKAGLATFPGDDPWKGFQFLVRDGDDLVGYVLYRAESKWEHHRPRCEVTVDDWVIADPAAAARAWRYLAEIDLVVTVKAEHHSVDSPLPHLLTDGRAVRQTDRHDMLWLRPLDVPALLRARRYRCRDALTVEVVDPGGPAEGRWHLDAGPDGATCAATTAAPDVTLPATALGAAYLGGTSVLRLAAAGLVDEHRPGALARLDTLCSWAPAPWCSTWF